jgi:hypothetical protein
MLMSQQPPDRPPEGWEPAQQPPPPWDRPPEPLQGGGQPPPPPPQQPGQEPPLGPVREFFRRYPAAFFLGILLPFIILAVLFGGKEEAADTDTSSPAPASERTDSESEVDASTQLSCAHFRNIMSDVAQGVLNDVELRNKLKEVNDSASVSERADVRAGGVAMLRAMTTGTTEEFLTAAGEFDQACDRAGQ